MSMNPIPPIPPLIDGGAEDANVPVREVDGEELLDPDADATGIDGAEADRIAAEHGGADDVDDR
ncbi:hypothetical protein ACI3KS_15310 [Microbacterium sp. ZW T5_45]|uniref:hypothetical protein n=1 Tax=Microbacterium sp. ZW T5_45 TaxID=3378080 RepID=UPI0038525C58